MHSAAAANLIGSATMVDERPRPQYGEYAPEGWVSPVAEQQTQTPEPVAPTPVTPAAQANARPLWDRVLTVALLGMGLYSVVSGYVSFSNFAAVLDEVFAAQGVGDFTATDAAAPAGLVINIVQTMIWVATLMLSMSALRRNRIAFIWPLLGGIATVIVIAIVLAIVVSADPAWQAYIVRMSG